jgi:murein DD-endopeptidase MepM/ murein hydrolase activator NlpD
MRQHPILGVWKMHAGTDYAATSGTPVRAVGDGVVIFAGRKGGYGNVLEVRHGNGYVSRYGHLRTFGPGVRRGSHVGIGKTIGFVGMTGLATAPHLHFEMLLSGAQRDPGAALRRADAALIPRAQRETFEAMRARLLGRTADAGGAHPSESAG